MNTNPISSASSPFFFAFTFIINIAMFSSAASNLRELSLLKDSTISFNDYYGFYLHLDISAMKYQEQGVITFKFPEKQFENAFMSFDSKVVQTKESIIFSFPVNRKESIFEHETAYEAKYDSDFRPIRHLYFNKTINESERVFLLIELMFDRDKLEPFRHQSIWVSRVSLIEDISFPLNYNKVTFYRELDAFLPVYFGFNLLEKYMKDNVVFYSRINAMTVHYDGLVINGKINEKRLFNQIASSDQYFTTTEGNQHSKFIIKFLSKKEIVSFKFEVCYTTNPVIIMKSFFNMQMYPIEITNQNQIVFLVGIYNRTTSNAYNYYLNIESIYGRSIVQYSSDFNLDYIVKHDQSLTPISNVFKMQSEINFLRVKCLSPCRLTLVLFTNIKLENIYRSGVYYLILNHRNDLHQITEISAIDDFVIQIESLGEEVSVGYNGNQQSLSKNENMRREIKANSLRDERVSFAFKSSVEAYLKIILHKRFSYSIIPLGKSEYYMQTILFKFEENLDVESFVIEFTIKRKSQYLSYFYSHYGYGDELMISLPSTKVISFIQKRVFTFSNPYDKVDQKIKENQFYYFIMQAFDDNMFEFSVNYYHVYKQKYPVLDINTPWLMLSEISIDNHMKRTLLSNDFPNQKIVMQFFTCASSKIFQYQLFYNQNLLNRQYITNNRTRITIDNYHVNYTIDFYGYKEKENQFAFIFSYSYCDESAYHYFFDNSNYTINYSLKGSSLSLQWHTYLKRQMNQVYKIYITEYKEESSNCSFINDKPYAVLYYHQAIEEETLSYYCKGISRGKYRVNIIAQENKTYHFTQIYDETIISIINNNSSISSILIFISSILCLGSCYLRYFIKERVY